MTPTQQHKEWRSDVAAVVRHLEQVFPTLECITYLDHPWPRWDGRSFDVWDDAETWTPAGVTTLRLARAHLMRLDWGPAIRHTILGHVLWTSWGGASRWSADDHSGRFRHLHVTYW